VCPRARREFHRRLILDILVVWRKVLRPDRQTDAPGAQFSSIELATGIGLRLALLLNMSPTRTPPRQSAGLGVEHASADRETAL